MTETTYLASKKVATTALIGHWVAYCDQPSLRSLQAFSRLQHQLELAALHAVELNYAAALDALPVVVPNNNPLFLIWPSQN